MHTILPSLVTFLLALFAPGWLGVYLDEQDGRVVVTEVIPQSPAASAGLKGGDWIRTLDGTALESLQGFVDAIVAMPAGRRIQLGIVRGDRNLTVQVTLGERPAETVPQPKTGQAAARPYLGVELEESDGAVRIASVAPGSPAAAAGLQAGMQITRIGDRDVASFEDLQSGLEGRSAGDSVRIQVMSGDRRTTRTVKLGARPGAPAAEPAPKPPVAAQPIRPQPPERAAATLDWGQDLAAAKQKAKAGGGGKPVLVVFGASWCANCKALERALQDASLQDLLGGFQRVWIDTDRQSRLADEYRVQEIPHMLVLAPDGKVVAQQVGYLPPATIAELLEPHAGTAQASRPLVARAVPAQDLESELASLRKEVAELRALVEKLMAERQKGQGR